MAVETCREHPQPCRDSGNPSAVRPRCCRCRSTTASPEDHPACFIIDRIDLTALAASFSGRSKAVCHPSIMTALLIHCCAGRVFSIRRAEEACRDRLPFRFAACNLVPDRDTIAGFRRRFGPLLEEFFFRNEIELRRLVQSWRSLHLQVRKAGIASALGNQPGTSRRINSYATLIESCDLT